MTNVQYKTAGQVITIYEQALRDIIKHANHSPQGEIAQQALDAVYKPKRYKARVIDEVRERYAPYEQYFAKDEIIEVIKGIGRHNQQAWVVVDHAHENFMFGIHTIEILDELP